VLLSEGARVIKTPTQTPKANAFAERWVRTARQECLDHILILGRRHLLRTLREFEGHYNGARPHRGLKLACPSPPVPSRPSGTTGTVWRRDRLSGMIHEYYRETA
jgi:transposase InsO family protein